MIKCVARGQFVVLIISPTDAWHITVTLLIDKTNGMEKNNEENDIVQ